MARLVIVTPARDEAPNIPRIEAALKAQSVPIDLWIVLENGSTDATSELLERIQPAGALKSVLVTHENTSERSYAVGFKYARLIARGFTILRENGGIDDGDFVGILDADTFPEPRYYEKLLAAMAGNRRLGITSGITVDGGGKESLHRRNWVRGSCRMWRGACLNDAGYPIGPSADSLSAIKATSRGWAVEVVPYARAEAREVGARVDYRYYGRAAYFRGESVLHCLLRTIKHMAALQPRAGLLFFLGYMGDLLKRVPQTDDRQILDWSRGAVPRMIRQALLRRSL